MQISTNASLPTSSFTVIIIVTVIMILRTISCCQPQCAAWPANSPPHALFILLYLDYWIKIQVIHEQVGVRGPGQRCLQIDVMGKRHPVSFSCESNTRQFIIQFTNQVALLKCGSPLTGHRQTKSDISSIPLVLPAHWIWPPDFTFSSMAIYDRMKTTL
jgi:hypothetical protein